MCARHQTGAMIKMNAVKKFGDLSLACSLLLCFAKTAIAQETSSMAESPGVLAGRYEKALTRNPNDDEALEKLHFLIARDGPFSRDERIRLKQVIQQYTRLAQTKLALPDEPGEPMVVSGTVRNADDKPISGALIYVFHADARGHYAPNAPMDEPGSRLFGFMKTGADGRYEFRTIRPGGYPHAPIPQHIHLLVTASGYRDHKCRSTCQLVFKDDSRMTAEWHKWANEGGHPVLSVTRDKNGIQRCVYDIVLRRD